MTKTDISADIASVTAWNVTGVFLTLIFFVFFVLDIYARWGSPLVLEWTVPTLVWAVSYYGARLSYWRAERTTAKYAD